MSAETFARVLEGIRSFRPTPSVLFGGYGEPLAHPQIFEMVLQARRAGAQVELITNGILLSKAAAQNLIDAGLDRLWVSLDGATPASYADVRLGAALPDVTANLKQLQELRSSLGADRPRLGIAFVAMKRNIGDFPGLVQLGKSLGADRYSVSHVLPHTPELRSEMLYTPSAGRDNLAPAPNSPHFALPRLDPDLAASLPLVEGLGRSRTLSIAGQEIHGGANRCPFIEKASVSIRWDGAVSPCLALLHTHASYLGDHVRKSNAFAAGSLAERSLAEIWQDPSYRSLRERLLQFDFSPCIDCNSCEMADSNLEDCFGNILPACGGCLWAQGFIQCP